MPSSVEALAVFLIFLPGFVAQKMVEILTPRRPYSAFERFVNAASLSLLVYALYVPFTLLHSFQLLPVSADPVKSISANASSVGLLLVLGVLVGLVVGHGASTGWIYRALRGKRWPFVRLTNRTGRATVWEDAFAGLDSPALCAVFLKDGTRIMGWVRYYSEDPANRELLITPYPGIYGQDGLPRVAVMDETPDNDAYECRAVLLTPAAEIQRIDFVSPSELRWEHERGREERTTGTRSRGA